MAKWVRQKDCPSITSRSRRRTRYLAPLREPVERILRDYLAANPHAEDATLEVLSRIGRHRLEQVPGRASFLQRKQDLGLLVAQTLVDLHGDEHVVTLRADGSKAVSTRRNGRLDLDWVERYTPHRIQRPHLPPADRVLLDTTLVRKIVSGDWDAIDAQELHALLGRHPLSILPGALAELAAALIQRRLPFDVWSEGLGALGMLTDLELPVVPGGLELLTLAGLRPIAGVDLGGLGEHYREAWRHLHRVHSPSDLEKPADYDGPDGKRHRARLDRAHVEGLLDTGNRWDEWLEELAAGAPGLDEEGLRRLLRTVLRLELTTAALDRIDLPLRALARRASQMAGRRALGGDTRGDAVDFDLLFGVAMPAVICTVDSRLLALARATGSPDAWRVMSPAELLDWLSRSS